MQYEQKEIVSKLTTLLLVICMMFVFTGMSSAELDMNQDGMRDFSSQNRIQFNALETDPIFELTIGLVQTGSSRTVMERLTDLGYSITLIPPDSGLSAFEQYDVVYLPSSWADALNGNFDIVESHSADYQDYVQAGGGLFIDQPNPYKQPSGTVTPTLLPYPITFHVSGGIDEWPPIIVNTSHEITRGLSESEMPAPADRMSSVDSQYEVLVVGRASGYPSLVIGQYGNGRILVQTANPSRDAFEPFSDEVYIRMVNWVGSRGGNSTTTTTLCPSLGIYGEGSEEVRLLRYFRDGVLRITPEGQELIKLYYQWSPFIVQTMENDEKFKEWIKEMINSLLPIIERKLE